MAILEGAISGNLAEVETVSKGIRSALYDGAGNPLALLDSAQPASPYGLLAMGLNDGRAVPSRVDRFGSQSIALNNPLLSESFEGTTTHPMRWLITNTTMAAAQTTVGGLLFNSGSITTLNTGYMIKSTRLFQKLQRMPIQAKFRLRMVHFNNSVMEFGFGDAATFNGANTAGAYWQRTSSGAMQPVVTYNSVDQTGTDISASLNSANYYTFDVLMDDDEATFFCQNTATGAIISQQKIALPITGQRLLSATALPVMCRLYNTASAPATAPQLLLTDVAVVGLDADFNFPAPHIFAGQGRGFYEHPFTGAQLATFANSAAPSNATLSNTAAGYTTLGGLFSFAAVAGAATDYALFGFQVPAPANFFCTGIDIETWNTGAAVATTPHLLVWGIATQLTAVSLATAAHARIPVGVQSLPVAAAIGAAAQRISKQFQTPILCSSGRFFDVILRMPVATNTASQVIQGLVTVEGYFA
ncbi:MAG: hypothetical protein ABIR33_09470 [Pyrinomonadaceae bacterium]